MDVHLRRFAAAQADMVATWQLIGAGWTHRAIERRAEAAAWTLVHFGVYAMTQAPLTQRQRWFAATLTEPGTVLSHESAACCCGFLRDEQPYVTVTRPGSGGPRQLDAVQVFRSRQLDGETTQLHGIPITTGARTLIDIAARSSHRATGRAFREALRVGATTPRELAAALARHRGRRGTRLLWGLTERYSQLPYRRTRSNAEARGLEVLQDAGLLPQAVNVRIAGEEADFIWLDRRLIVEIDGPQYHQFKNEDERKRRCWEAAGYTVRRIPSDEVYAHPEALVALASR